MNLPSPLSALIKTSVLINGVWVQGRQAATSLQRFCRPVCFFNEGSDYEVSTAGSCFLFRYRGSGSAKPSANTQWRSRFVNSCRGAGSPSRLGNGSRCGGPNVSFTRSK